MLPQNLDATSATALIKAALPKLSEQQEAEIHGYNTMLKASLPDSSKIGVFKKLSSAWFKANSPALAGHYAEEVAKLNSNDTTWGIAGTTFSLCLQKDSLSTKEKSFCKDRAVHAFEQAISLNPEKSAHKINLALLYTNFPPENNPMKGILMLLELNKQNPNDVAVLIQLGRLSLRTGQDQKAVSRLSHAVEVEPENKTAHCLLVEAASRVGDKALMEKSMKLCSTIN